MRKLTRQEVVFEVECQEEYDPVRGNALSSGDEEEDRRVEDQIIQDFNNGNPWPYICRPCKGEGKQKSACGVGRKTRTIMKLRRVHLTVVIDTDVPADEILPEDLSDLTCEFDSKRIRLRVDGRLAILGHTTVDVVAEEHRDAKCDHAEGCNEDATERGFDSEGNVLAEVCSHHANVLETDGPVTGIKSWQPIEKGY